MSAFFFFFSYSAGSGVCFVCLYEISGDITSFKRPFLTCLFYIPALADGVRLLVFCVLRKVSRGGVECEGRHPSMREGVWRKWLTVPDAVSLFAVMVSAAIVKKGDSAVTRVNAKGKGLSLFLHTTLTQCFI